MSQGRPSRPRALLASVCALAALALLVACSGEPVTAQDDAGPATTGERADFRLDRLAGGSLGPPDLAGRVVLVDFWATWCVPCHAQADILKDLYPKVRGDGVEFLAVDVGEERDLVERFVASRPFPYPVLLDPDSAIADSLGVYSLPTLLIVDRKGRISYFSDGIHDEDELLRLLAAAGA